MIPRAPGVPETPAATGLPRLAGVPPARGVARAFARPAAVATPAAIPRVRWRRDDALSWPLAAMAWVLVVLMIVPEGFDYSTLGNEAGPEYGGTLSRLLWLGLLGMAGAVLLWRATLAWLLMRWLNLLLLAFVVLAAASVAWSVDPPVTARRLVRLATIVACALAFVLMAWHARRFQNVLRAALTAVLLGSLAFGLLRPDLAIHDQTDAMLAGAWRGLANHKNGLGDLASIGLIFWFHAWLCREVSSLRALLGAGAALACLLLSQSATSLVVTVFTLLFLGVLVRTPGWLRPYLAWVVALFVLSLLVYALALLRILPGLYTLLGPVGAITGKDMTFTGRTEIWDLVAAHSAQNPLLGTGYGAYWTGVKESAASYVFIEKLGFYPASAHNGYLDVLNDLGVVGLTLLLGYLAVFVAQCLSLLPVDRRQAALYLALFVQQAITNLAESRWLSVLSVDFVIFTLATTALARSRLEHHLRRVAAPPAPPAPTPATARLSHARAR